MIREYTARGNALGKEFVNEGGAWVPAPRRDRGGGGGDGLSLGAQWDAFLLRFFMPANYPESVSDDYAEWLRWHLSSLFCRYILEVMSSQALLVAVSSSTKLDLSSTVVGAPALAAATNWVLKDGFGSFATLAVGSRGGQNFDEDPKRQWVVSSAIEDVAGTIELLLPLHPQWFLPAAAAARALRSGALVGRNSLVNGTIMRHFGLQENFSDVRAKLEAQGRSLALISLPLAIALFRFAQQTLGPLSDPANPGAASAASLASVLALYAAIIGAHNVACYKAADALAFRTLNRRRLLIVAGRFVRGEAVGTPAEVAKEEGIFVPRRDAQGPVLGATLEDLAGVTEFPQAVRLFAAEGFVLVPSAVGGRPLVALKRGVKDAHFFEAALAAQALAHQPSGGGRGDALGEARTQAKAMQKPFEAALLSSGWELQVVRGAFTSFDFSSTQGEN